MPNAKPTKPNTEHHPDDPTPSQAVREELVTNDKQPFYIVGLGGSAGGLEAFEEFFDAMPSDSGMAFIVVSHLDPTRKGMMPELLQRRTKMRVVQAEDGMKVLPNSIYIIPPNKDLSILNCVLQLLEPAAPRGQRLPINFFFQQLAEDQKEYSMCVILSGMGADGTEGLKAVKQKLGSVMAQDVTAAKHDSMPRSAISTGLVDYVGTASELAQMLVRYSMHTADLHQDNIPLTEKTTNALQKVFVLLRTQTGNDFSLYKQTTIQRRIARRMSVHQLNNLSSYVQYLQSNPQEIDFLFKELLIGVTGFFREPDAYEVLREKIITYLQDERQQSIPFRVWIPGCSTGEEAYSIAMIIKECEDSLRLRDPLNVQIFATDLDKDAINKARQAIYPPGIASEISPDRLHRFFVKEQNNYRVKKEIREKLIFAPQNVIMDPPFTKLSLLCCRNLLIYMTPELQQKVLPLFHFSLKPQGLLFLGSAESVTGHGHLFAPVDSKWKIFQRKEQAFPRGTTLEFPLVARKMDAEYLQHAVKTPANTEATLQGVTQRILMDHYAPPAVVINGEGDIVYLSGWTGKFLEPAPGKAYMNIHAMAREGLKHQLAGAIRKAMADLGDVNLPALKVKSNGGHLWVKVTVKYLTEPDFLQGLLMVVFEEVAVHPAEATADLPEGKTSSKKHVQIADLEDELKMTRQHLQVTIEEMETTQEELKSTNEELQSTNEELQSTNEEITTSKEEMQSLNEELITVNAELEKHVAELTLASNDMKNLLDSTNIATIFLDLHLNIMRFTPQAAHIINVIPSDVGRPIGHLTQNLKAFTIVEDVNEVLRTLVFRELEVQATDDKWYLMRISPYRTYENLIDGVVMTFIDITSFKQLEQTHLQSEQLLRESRDFAESIVASLREPLMVVDDTMCVLTANDAFYETFHLKPDTTLKRSLAELCDGKWNLPLLREQVTKVLQQSVSINDVVLDCNFGSTGPDKLSLSARQIQRENSGRKLILLVFKDLTEHA